MTSCQNKVCNPFYGEQPEQWVTEKVSAKVKEVLAEMQLTDDVLRQDMTVFEQNIERGLKKDTHPDSIVKCFITYVQDLPNGSETGKYLALDLGGTNFRVLLVDLAPGKCDLTSDIYSTPVELQTGTGIALFDHIAASLADFIKNHGLENEFLDLGFTFSFPLLQKGLRSGTLVKWTKGYNIPEMIGEDVVKWLREAIERRGDVKINVCAILNDTTGTLMSCAWKNPKCRIGMIVGTGHNACYLEKQSNAEMFDEPDLGSGKVIINLEAAALGDDGALDFLRTDIDREVDAESPNPGKQINEKLISGMFLGEVVRKYTLKFIKSGDMFGGKHDDVFSQRGIIQTSFISNIESDQTGHFDYCKQILAQIGITDASEQDMIDLRYICQLVSTRSAYLCAADASVLIKRIGEPDVVVGIDGSVYKFHPLFRRIMKEKMKDLLDPSFKFDLMLSEDGSGRGAALVAAMAAMRAA
ncbi:hexokinase type 2-like [Anthonomus grandis grandis]|uniref:hexokinase type 2-like n=1 Tax=Anthonomus grandis grandis TaxID=2921223 RepID=UPI002166B091|nr:hexokinase type 2-like [Anthonomus grandis grandis]